MQLRAVHRLGVVLAAAASMATSGGCEYADRSLPSVVSPPPASVEPTPYVIAPGDQLEVRFFHTPELNVVLPVRPDGFISLPFAHEVRAAGRTPEELRRDLVARYARELEAPEIAVIVQTFSAYRVHVGGEVDEPGIVPYTDSISVVDSIFAAGGFLPTARVDEVLVIRRGAKAGEYSVIPVDLKLALNGEDPAQNIQLAPYDAVFVPRSTVADVNLWVDQYIRQNIPVNFGIRVETFQLN